MRDAISPGQPEYLPLCRSQRGRRQNMRQSNRYTRGERRAKAGAEAINRRLFRSPG